MSEDPIGFDGGDINVYRYVLNSPINKIDSSGKGPILYEMCLVSANLSSQALLLNLRTQRDETLKALDEQIKMLNEMFANADSCSESKASLEAEIKEIERLKKITTAHYYSSYAATALLTSAMTLGCGFAAPLPTP